MFRISKDDLCKKWKRIINRNLLKKIIETAVGRFLKYGYVAWSTPFVIVSTAFSNLVRAKGKSTEALNGILIGTIQNIVLNRLFILWLGYRIAGAAWATAIGYTAANAYYVILLTGKDSHLTIFIACFNMRKETVGPFQAVIRLSCFAGLVWA